MNKNTVENEMKEKKDVQEIYQPEDIKPTEEIEEPVRPFKIQTLDK